MPLFLVVLSELIQTYDLLNGTISGGFGRPSILQLQQTFFVLRKKVMIGQRIAWSMK